MESNHEQIAANPNVNQPTRNVPAGPMNTSMDPRQPMPSNTHNQGKESCVSGYGHRLGMIVPKPMRRAHLEQCVERKINSMILKQISPFGD